MNIQLLDTRYDDGASPRPVLADPINPHGCIAAPSTQRDLLRSLIATVRAQSGPVLIITAPRLPMAIARSTAIKSIDLSSDNYNAPFRFPAYRAFCESLVSEQDAQLLRQAWAHCSPQYHGPGDVRQIVVYPVQGAQPLSVLREHLTRQALPGPLDASSTWMNGTYVLARNEAQVREIAGLGWHPHTQWLEALNNNKPVPLEDRTGMAWSVGRRMTIANTRTTLAQGLMQVLASDENEGAEARCEHIMRSIEAGLAGSVAWEPWSDPFQVFTSSEEDGLRIALILERCLQECDRRCQVGASPALCTIVLDQEAATHPRVRAIAEQILRTGRKINCALVSCGESYPAGMWSDFGGFYVYEDDSELVVVIDEGTKLSINDVFPAGYLTDANRLMQTGEIHRKEMTT